jgi:SWI/SNF-related matrix-associated actin-dependent regulator of chromatin subfamily A3
MNESDHAIVLLDGWIEEIDKFDVPEVCVSSAADICRHIFRGSLRYCKYHGQDRPKDPSILVRYDVVLTTYGTVVADFNRPHKVLENVKWYRLIADEGIWSPEIIPQ